MTIRHCPDCGSTYFNRDGAKALDEAKRDGFRAGIEAAAKVCDEAASRVDAESAPVVVKMLGAEVCRTLAGQIRALAAAPDAPDATGAREAPCSCGKVPPAFFTGTHSQLTKEGEQFISTNHRRDRCDREEVIPDPAAAPPRSERREGEPATFVRCKRCGGSGRMGNPHIIDGWPVRCSECKGTGSASPAAPKEEE